jgi:signal transduction histidine kinase/CheY-like chemotaxis protein
VDVIRSKLLVPLLGLILTVSAIAGVWTVLGQGRQAREAQSRVATMKVALAELQLAPFYASPLAGGSPQAARVAIAADERAIARGLTAASQSAASPALLARGRADLTRLDRNVSRIYEAAVQGLLVVAARDPALIPSLHAALGVDSAALLAALDGISGADGAGATSARDETKLGVAAAMLLLFAAFALFYFRSVLAGEAARRAARASAVARDLAVEASSAKSMFVATVSHELRTPLSGMIGLTDLLLDTELESQQREYVHLAHSAAEGLLVVVGDILDFAKIEAGKIALDEADFSLADTIIEACAMLQITARGTGVALDLNIDPDLPPSLRGDRARMRQVVTNLVANAVKFTDRGNVTVTASAIPVADAWRIRVEVTDSGIGIEPDALAQLFQPFAQADNSTSRKYGGTGLGLTISARLIEAMGGEIGASSEPGSGSTFWFELTLAEGSANGQVRPSVLELSTLASRSDAGAERILVADDNEINRIVAVSLLETAGYAADSVCDGSEAVLALEQTRYAAVLMDCQMPVLDGYAAAREIRRLENGHSHVPIIALTAYSMPGDREKCMAAGMDDYLNKPVTAEVLAETLARQIAATPESDALAAPAIA